MPHEVPHAYGAGDLPVEIDRDRAVILGGDSVAVLPRLAAGVADALVTDPPYGLEFNGHAWDGAAGFAESLPRLWRIKESSYVVQHQLHPAELQAFDTRSRMLDPTAGRAPGDGAGESL